MKAISTPTMIPQDSCAPRSRRGNWAEVRMRTVWLAHWVPWNGPPGATSQLVRLMATYESIMVVTNSLAPLFARIHPGMNPQMAPAPAPNSRHTIGWITGGSLNVNPAQAAKNAPR